MNLNSSCPPQQALTIVIEIQTSTIKKAPVDQLETTAWAKFPLFDNKNRLISGRWKVPIKKLPVLFHETLATVKNLPSVKSINSNIETLLIS